MLAFATRGQQPAFWSCVATKKAEWQWWLQIQSNLLSGIVINFTLLPCDNAVKGDGEYHNKVMEMGTWKKKHEVTAPLTTFFVVQALLQTQVSQGMLVLPRPSSDG